MNLFMFRPQLKKLANNADKYEEMGEAEQFMFQVCV